MSTARWTGDALGDMTRACDLWGMTSITRVNANDPGLITRTLDRGSMGIVVPHVSNREAAEKAAQSAKYAPVGYRGMFGGRQSFGVSDYFHTANSQTMVVVLLEEAEALENIDEILKVDNIDVFFVAPSDLAQTMGHIGNTEHPEVQAAIEEAIGKIVNAGRIPRHPRQRCQHRQVQGYGRQVPDDVLECVGSPRSGGVPAKRPRPRGSSGNSNSHPSGVRVLARACPTTPAAGLPCVQAVLRGPLLPQELLPGWLDSQGGGSAPRRRTERRSRL